MAINYEKLADFRQRLEERRIGDLEGLGITLEELGGCLPDTLSKQYQEILKNTKLTKAAVYLLSALEFYKDKEDEAIKVLANTSRNGGKWGFLEARNFYRQQKEMYERRNQTGTPTTLISLECSIDNRLSPGYGSIGGPGFFRGSDDSPPSWDDAVRSVEDSR